MINHKQLEEYDAVVRDGVAVQVVKAEFRRIGCESATRLLPRAWALTVRAIETLMSIVLRNSTQFNIAPQPVRN